MCGQHAYSFDAPFESRWIFLLLCVTYVNNNATICLLIDHQRIQVNKELPQFLTVQKKNIAENYPVHDVCPSFHSHALEHSQHREAEVVKVRDAVIRTFPSSLAHQFIIAIIVVDVAAKSTAARMNRIYSDLVCTTPARFVIWSVEDRGAGTRNSSGRWTPYNFYTRFLTAEILGTSKYNTSGYATVVHGRGCNPHRTL